MRTRAVVVMLVVLASCRTAPQPRGTPSGGFPSQLGRAATALAPSANASSTPGQNPPGTGTPASSNATATTTTRATATAAPVFTQRGAVGDATGDQGANAPGYSDLIRLVIESDGSNARVTVTMNASIPNPMPSGEEMAVGVDVFRSSGEQESDYQLYASGNADGWVAFLDTPGGFVRYPGTFQIGGAKLVFVVPWSSLGNISRGYASSFMDWDRKGVVLNTTGEDRAPDGGKMRYF